MAFAIPDVPGWLKVSLGATGIGVFGGLVLRSIRVLPPTEDNGPIDDREDYDAPSDPSARGRDLIPRLGRLAGLSDEQARFLNFVARGESGWNPEVGRGDPSLGPVGIKIVNDIKNGVSTESRAASIAYERRADIFEGCGHDPAKYQFGSGGLFAMLPTYALYHLRNTPLRCASPFEVFDEAFAIAAGYSFARGVSQNRSFDGTVKSLRAGWGSLKRMGDPALYAHKLAKWREHAQDCGLPASYIDGPAPHFDKKDLYGIYQAAGGEL